MAEEIITSTNVETATDHEYNASEIQVLKGLEAVRKRPGMWKEILSSPTSMHSAGMNTSQPSAPSTAAFRK